MLRLRLFLIIVVMTMSSLPVSAGDMNKNLKWSRLPSLPPAPGQNRQPGFAGPFIGVSNEALIVAGGANFPGKLPWDGGPKLYYDDAFVLIRTDQGQSQWLTGFHLPRAIAY